MYIIAHLNLFGTRYQQQTPIFADRKKDLSERGLLNPKSDIQI